MHALERKVRGRIARAPESTPSGATRGRGAPPAGGARRALIAATDKVAGGICRSALEACSWEVVVVDSGVAAVIAARQTIPTMIFMDLQLRDVPGREAVGWLRSNPELTDVPIILIAGGAEDDDEIAVIHPSALLRKPVNRREVERLAGMPEC